MPSIVSPPPSAHFQGLKNSRKTKQSRIQPETALRSKEEGKNSQIQENLQYFRQKWMDNRSEKTISRAIFALSFDFVFDLWAYRAPHLWFSLSYLLLSSWNQYPSPTRPPTDGQSIRKPHKKANLWSFTGFTLDLWAYRALSCPHLWIFSSLRPPFVPK